MSDKGTFDGAQTVGKNQAMNTIGTGAIIQDSEVKTITSAGASQGEINALKSMQNAGLLGKDVSLYEKKVSDAGNFTAVDKDGNKITMYTDSKGNILGYEKQTIDPSTKEGGAGVKTIHAPDGRVLAKVEDGATQKNYQNTKDLRITTDYTMENKGAAMKLINENLRLDMANAKTQEDRENIAKNFLERTRHIDAAANPGEELKSILKNETSETDGLVYSLDKEVKPWVQKNIPGAKEFYEGKEKLADLLGVDKK
jgi:hypothetical protein